MTPIAFARVWDRAVAARGAHPFLRFEAPDRAVTEWTYAEFDSVVRRAAGLLSSNGVGVGDSVHLALTNCPAFIAIWLATNRLGAWIVSSDPMGAAGELRGHLERTAPSVAFCATTRAAAYRDAAAGSAVHIVEIDEASSDSVVIDGPEYDGRPNLDPLARAAVMFTSGTTGRPKGVEITQANYAFTGQTMATAAGLEAEHRQLVVLPLFHANAQFYSVASAIWAGASVALMHTFSASGFLRQAAHHGATHASLFAAPMRMILSRSEAPDRPVGLRHCWYAMNISPDQHATFTNWLGCAPRQLYGMTETIPAVISEPAGDAVPGTMGFATPGCLVDLDHGEIVVGGERGVTIFAGYLDDPETTAAGFQRRADGKQWFFTGDRASRDTDGRFRFAGRGSDVLKVAGENVSTVEVEQVLSSHPGVLEAAVVGQPDDIRDEVPVAFVVANDPASPPSMSELHEWCATHLTKAKRPRDISLVDQLPRTSVGKIRKFLLRDTSSVAMGGPSR